MAGLVLGWGGFNSTFASATEVSAIPPHSLRLDLHGGVSLHGNTMQQYGWKPGAEPSYLGGLYFEALGWEVGAQYWSWQTHQSISTENPEVRLRGFGAEGGKRLIGSGSFSSWLKGGVGLQNISYAPDEIALSIDGISEAIRVPLQSETEPVISLGLESRVNVVRGLGVSLRATRAWWWMDTAHRRDDVVILERESFSHWRLTLGFAWRMLSS